MNFSLGFALSILVRIVLVPLAAAHQQQVGQIRKEEGRISAAEVVKRNFDFYTVGDDTTLELSGELNNHALNIFSLATSLKFIPSGKTLVEINFWKYTINNDVAKAIQNAVRASSPVAIWFTACQIENGAFANVSLRESSIRDVKIACCDVDEDGLETLLSQVPLELKSLRLTKNYQLGRFFWAEFNAKSISRFKNLHHLTVRRNVAIVDIDGFLDVVFSNVDLKELDLEAENVIYHFHRKVLSISDAKRLINLASLTLTNITE